jgi:hypothetical protein
MGKIRHFFQPVSARGKSDNQEPWLTKPPRRSQQRGDHAAGIGNAEKQKQKVWWAVPYKDAALVETADGLELYLKSEGSEYFIYNGSFADVADFNNYRDQFDAKSDKPFRKLVLNKAIRDFMDPKTRRTFENLFPSQTKNISSALTQESPGFFDGMFDQLAEPRYA